MNKSHKSNSSGVDNIYNFWVSSLSDRNGKLASLLSEIVESHEAAPKWLSESIKYLSPKTKDIKNPKNYRPTTCLTTTWKLLTSILTERTYTFMENNNMFPLEQKECKKGSYGYKDLLFINKMLLEHWQSKQRNMSMKWIDCRKAFDSVPHNWIIKAFELFKVLFELSEFYLTNLDILNLTL